MDSGISNVIIKQFSNTTRLGHIILYYLLRKEADGLVKRIVKDYNIKGVKYIELQQVIQSPSYIQINPPTDLYENALAESTHIRRVKEYNETLSHSS
jgi:hypothetical protein